MAIISIFVHTAMNHLNKVRLKWISACLSLFTILTVQSQDTTWQQSSFHNYLTTPADTTKRIKKNVQVPKINNEKKEEIIAPTAITDTTKRFGDTTRRPNIDTPIVVQTRDTFDFKISRDSLDAPITYDAEDSMVLDVPTKKITLYGKKTNTDYKDNNLTAPVIELNQQTGTLIASIRRDSAGKVLSMPTYKQGDFTSTSDSLKFNLKSGKGITKSTYTQQGEMFVYGETIKKIDNNVFFAQKGRFTTCNLDTPHFAFVSNRIKFINKKLAITGPVHPEFEGVPIPLYLPFGIFPLSQGRHSGFIMPSFTTNEQLGLSLERMGYYKVLNDYWDVLYYLSIYSYGSWTMNINPRYRKLYHYQGSLSLDVQNFKYNFKGDPDFSKNRSYHISWNHSADTKARPGVTFSGHVDAGSSSYNSRVPNDPYRNFQNQLSSSIAYSKTWKDKNLTISANHNQNTLQKLININLPDVAFNLQTLYPFRKKEFVGEPKWYENIGVAYNGNAKSQFSFYDTAKNILSHIIDTFQWGAHHSVPISLSLPQLGAFQIAPSVSYDETWYQTKVVMKWNRTNKKLDTSISKGFYTARDMSFGVGISTRIFGLITSKSKDAKLQAIRHEIRPSISFSYKPNFNRKNYYKTQVDTLNTFNEFSVFPSTANIFGPYGQGEFGGISFSIDNNIQMKVRNKRDTGENAIKKVTLIDGLSFNGSYNLMVDSFNFSMFNLSLLSNLFNKINLTAGALLDPYQVNTNGRRINTLVWKKNPFSLGRLLSGSVSVSSQFQGGKEKNKQTTQNPINDYQQTGYDDLQSAEELAYIRNNPAEYTDFNIPWSVNFSYALRFNKIFQQAQRRFITDVSQDISGGGTLGLTKKWQIAVNGSYNITRHEIGVLSVSLAREMHCWGLSVNMSPIGRYRFFSINISPKSSLLRDFKVNRTRSVFEGF
jgi:hypothetical protein